MLKVNIHPPVVKKTVSVHISFPLEKPSPKATLLGSSGEALKTFPLTQPENELSLEGFAAGAYTLRIEAGNEVTVRQLIIPV